MKFSGSRKVAVIGEVLFDVFPDYEKLGGAPFNFASHLRALGFIVDFISRIGIDEKGRKIIERSEKNGLEPGGIQKDPEKATGRVVVSLDKSGTPSYNIVKDTAYDNLDPAVVKERLSRTSPSLLYFGTLIQRTENGRKVIEEALSFLSEDTKVFCDLNLRPECYSEETVKNSLANCDILKLNSEELEEISAMPGISPGKEKARGLMEKFGISLLCETRGADGAVLFSEENEIRMPAPPVKNMKDSVGAGDSFAAALAAGLLLGWSEKKALASALDLASKVCSIEGAVPDNDDIYNSFMKTKG
ncbi:MAG: PfkB family carbohydrate kinase [Fibrobacterota bacterium]